MNQQVPLPKSDPPEVPRPSSTAATAAAKDAPPPSLNVYEMHVAKIYGKKFWLTVIGIWFFLNFSLLYDFERFEFFEMDTTNYLYFFIATCIYYGVALFFYAKEFVINRKLVTINYKIGDFVFYKKSFDLEKVEELHVKDFSSASAIGQCGQMIFIRKNYFSRFPKSFRPSLLIPIYHIKAQDVLAQLLKKTYSAQLLLVKEADKLTIPLHKNLVLGRNTTPHLFKQDPNVGRQHAKITMTPDKEFLIEDLNSVNKTLLNGKEIEPDKKYPLHNGDKVKIAQTKFVVRNFQLQDFVDIQLYNTLYIFVPLKSLLKISFYIAIFTTFFIPLFIIYQLYFTSRDLRLCQSQSLPFCAHYGIKNYQLGQYPIAFRYLQNHCINPQDSQEALIGRSCLVAANAAKFMKETQSDIPNLLTRACSHKNLPGCTRLGMLTGNRPQVEKSMEQITEKCLQKKEGSACMEMARISALVSAPSEAIDYLQKALDFGFDDWWLIYIDPELASIQKTQSFEQLVLNREKYWRKWEKSDEKFPLINDEYFEFQKVRLFWKYNETQISLSCGKTFMQNESLKLSERFCSRKVLLEFVKYARKNPTQQVMDIAHMILPIFRYEDKLATTLWEKLEVKIDSLEFETLYFDQLDNRPFFNVANLIGNILFAFQTRFEVLQSMTKKIKELDRLKNQYKDLYLKEQSATHPSAHKQAHMRNLLNRWTLVEDRFYRFSAEAFKWEAEQLSKNIERKLESYFDNIGDVKKMK